MDRRLLPLLGVGLAAGLGLASSSGGQASGLQPILKIAWREGPEYPMGIQDSVLGVVEGRVVSAGGFTRWPKDIVQRFPKAFGGEKSGFTSLAFEWDPAGKPATWTRIADIPGRPRQGAAMAVVDDALYALGGFSYTEPWTYRDAFRLRRKGGQWDWEKLACDLPWRICEASAAVIGRKIYLVGGADFFPLAGTKDANFYSESGRDGQPVGRALLELDTTRLEGGWKRLPDRPGVGQFDLAAAAAGGKLYVLGGVFAPNTARNYEYTNAVDSWVYSVTERSWSRLTDMPDGSNRRAIPYKDRYIILVAGYKYGKNRLVDGTTTEVYSPAEKRLDFKEKFQRTVLVYDTLTKRLGSADPLLDQTSWPMLALAGDTLYCLGGEGGARLWHPATFQVGTISEIGRNGD
jgi:hypothetical protein